MKFQNKREVVDAEEYQPYRQEPKGVCFCHAQQSRLAHVHAFAGLALVNPGDLVVTAENKRQTVMRPADFAEIYEKLDEVGTEKLTFGALKVGDHFIGFPLPGDNSGHGGYLGAQNLLRKTEMKCPEGKLEPVNHGVAINVRRGIPSNLPNGMPVILILP